jgi:hypothetical protein
MDIHIIKLCKDNKLVELKNIKNYKQYSTIIYKYAINENNLSIVEWIYSVNSNVIYEFPDILISKCMIVKSNESIKIQKDIIIILNWLYKFYKNTYYDFYHIFCYICEKGNLLIAQWLYSKFKYEIRLNRINKINNITYQRDLLDKIIDSNNYEMLLWIDNLNIKFNYSVLNILFNKICVNKKLNYISWFLNKKINYKVCNTTLEFIKNNNNIELSNIFKLIFPNYYCKIIDNKIISNKFISNIIKDNVLDDKKYIIHEYIDECLICIEKNEYNIKLECNHKFCRDCYIELKKCPMCLRNIDINKIILIKNES